MTLSWAHIGRFFHDEWSRARRQETLKRLQDRFEQGGLWAYEAEEGSLDSGGYGDLLPRSARNPELTKDLEDGGWIASGKPFSR